MYLLRYVRLITVLMACLWAVHLAAAPTDPILQLNPGGHSALIRGIAFTPDGRYLVSASDDKTIRVWDWHNGTARLIRGQQGDGGEGKIYAMALSPDGRTVAVGGWMKVPGETGHVIRIHDLATGQVLGLLRGHTNVVLALAFSPDGQQLVSGQGGDDAHAIIWDIPNRRLLHRLNGHTDRIYAVAFTTDGARVVTSSYDHSLRLWDATSGDLITPMLGHTDKVRAVAVAANGTIASGSWDHSIRLWDGNSGAFIRTLADQGTKVGSLSFSPDGQQLLSGNGNPTGTGMQWPCHTWSVATGEELHRYAGHDNIVLATAFTPDGQLVATAGGANQEIHLWDPRTGTVKQRLAGGGALTWAVGISADGSRIAWGNTYDQKHINDRGPLSYQLPLAAPGLGTPTSLTANSRTWRRAAPTHGAWSLQHVKGGNYGYDAILEIRRNGRMKAKIARGSTDGYDHRAYTFTPDGATIISGGMGGVLTAYDRAGSKLGNFVGHTSDIWAVAVSADGRLLVSGSDDQTVRLWNVATRELLLTVFHENVKNKNPTPRPPPLDRRGGEDNRGGEWVAWTPQGYYAASPNGDRMVGWQINRGPDQTPDYIEAAQLRDKFYRPDILAQAITLGSATEAVANAPSTTLRLEDLAEKLPPKFQVIQPNDGAKLGNKRVDFVIDIQPQPNSTPVDRIDIYVNGRLADIQRLGKMAIPMTAGSNRTKYTVTLDPGKNAIRIVATSRDGKTTQELSLFLNSTATASAGDLYLIAIGVSDYTADHLDLRYAAADATAFAAAIRTTTQGMYRNVHETVLVTDPGATPPTANNIRDALDQLRNAKPSDTIILFMAGHGINEDRGYYFLAQDATSQGSTWRSSTVVRWSDIQNALTDAAGKRLLFVDTCHSGAAINPRLIKDSADSRIMIFSATDGNTTSAERQELRHGVFTYSILQALSGAADKMPADNRIMIKELDAYISYRVPELTRDGQIPISHIVGEIPDFVFANKVE